MRCKNVHPDSSDMNSWGLGLPAGASQMRIHADPDPDPQHCSQQLGLPAGTGQVVGLAVALTVLQAKDLGIMRFYLADLIHELQLMNPAHSL